MAWVVGVDLGSDGDPVVVVSTTTAAGRFIERIVVPPIEALDLAGQVLGAAKVCLRKQQ